MSHNEFGVLVGVDGSEESLRAADWAAADAASAGDKVTVCYVSDVSSLVDVPLPERLRSDALGFGQRVVERALSRVERQPGSVAAGLVEEGNPAAELIRLAAGASRVVLGSRGISGLEKLVLGSVGAEVAAHAPCPVGIVRQQRYGRREVLVGVEASSRGDLALEFAFTYADRHGLDVHAVHAIHEQPVPLPEPDSVRDWRPPPERAIGHGVLADAVSPWARKFPAVRVESTVVNGSAAWALTQASMSAALAVVGSRGHGGVRGLLVGSVSQALLRHAECSVAVVH